MPPLDLRPPLGIMNKKLTAFTLFGDLFHFLSFLVTRSHAPYAGCSSFFGPFSNTGPCVSTVGGGGASPIRFE